MSLHRTKPLKLREVVCLNSIQVIPSLVFFILVDIYLLIVYLVANNCDVNLKLWILGSMILSFPTLAVTHLIKNLMGSTYAIFFELAATLVGFLWMTFGSVQLNLSTTCQSQSPLLWWTVFVAVTAFWCSLAGMVITLTLATLVSFYFTNK